MDVDRGQLVGRFLNDVAIVMDLHEFAPVGGRPRAGEIGGGASGSPSWVRGSLHASEAILAFARLRISGSKEAGSCRPSPLRWMSPPHAGHSRGNSSPTRAISFAQAIRETFAHSRPTSRRSSR